MPDISCEAFDCSVVWDKIKNGLSAADIQALGGAGSPQVRATETKLREIFEKCCSLKSEPVPPPALPVPSKPPISGPPTDAGTNVALGAGGLILVGAGGGSAAAPEIGAAVVPLLTLVVWSLP